VTVVAQEKVQGWIDAPVRLGLNLDLPWAYSIGEKSGVAGTFGVQSLGDVAVYDISMLIGTAFGTKMWVQAEAVHTHTVIGLPSFFVTRNFANVSAQYSLNSQMKIDATIGSLLTSNLVNSLEDGVNYTIQFGIGYAFKNKN
jgi:hypothetical protein